MIDMTLFGGGVVSGLTKDGKPTHINLKDHSMETVKLSIQKDVFGYEVSIIIFPCGSTARFIGDVRNRTDVILRDKDYKI
ncbi:hypothetical protein P19_0343 [Aeromonas phage P19]|uniref:Uncharacterized protein n=1 Tax=Aeromonas phage vB_AdhaM_G2 TaxID=3238786 RepID=A0AB39TZG6_9CAUD|nr:hypothetical protein P19_0343 [Aeromonas phage P19]